MPPDRKPRITLPDEPVLLTPGPLTTAPRVRQAMLRDWGSWDSDFRAMSAQIRRRLVAMLGNGGDEFDCVLMQGSGTFAVESMLATLIPPAGKSLVLANGAYGQRAAETLRYLGRDHVVLDKGDYLPPRGDEVAACLAKDPAITHVIAVHCETSSGILNPVEEIAAATQAAGRKLLVDSMSAFGAIPIEPAAVRYEALVSSANKCIEGVPGFGFMLVRTAELEKAEGNCHSISLDAYAQWRHMEKTGQWRFTPPTHVVAAFLEALCEHQREGGVEARGRRYAENRDVLVSGMRKLGFETLLADRWLSPIITTFFCPADRNFRFAQFYDLMKAKGFIIYPGKLTVVDSFRIGCIGQVDAGIMRKVVAAAGEALALMGVADASPPPQALKERAKLAA